MSSYSIESHRLVKLDSGLEIGKISLITIISNIYSKELMKC